MTICAAVLVEVVCETRDLALIAIRKFVLCNQSPPGPHSWLDGQQACLCEAGRLG